MSHSHRPNGNEPQSLSVLSKPLVHHVLASDITCEDADLNGDEDAEIGALGVLEPVNALLPRP